MHLSFKRFVQSKQSEECRAQCKVYAQGIWCMLTVIDWYNRRTVCWLFVCSLSVNELLSLANPIKVCKCRPRTGNKKKLMEYCTIYIWEHGVRKEHF